MISDKKGSSNNKLRFLIGLVLLLSVIFLFLFFNGMKNNSDSKINTGLTDGSTIKIQSKIERLSLLDWKRLYDENKNNDNYVILDVRTPQEVGQGKIDGAININFYDPDFKEQLNKLDKNKKYLIYCRSGARSSRALALTKELGFKEAYDLKGGILAWYKAGYNVVK